MNNIFAACKRDLLDIYHHAMDAVRPEKLIKNCVSFNDRKLLINNPLDDETAPKLTYDLTGSRIHLIGGGKCVLGMALGLAQQARDSDATHFFSHGCLSLPINTVHKVNSESSHLLSAINVACNFGSKNNLPDEDSVLATKNILARVDEATRQDKAQGLGSLFIFLLSGGGSSCLTVPNQITLEKKLAIIKELVQKGASIIELNTFRRFYSGVKGGNLARHILRNNPKSRILSLIISDVVGDPLEFVASGPTFLSNFAAPESDFESMSQILNKYDVEIPLVNQGVENFRFCGLPIDSQLVENILIGNNKLAIEALTCRASQLGYEIVFLGNNLTGPTNQILEQILSHATDNVDITCQRKRLIVCGGESTVVRGENETWGLGGRTQEMALDYMIAKMTQDGLQPRRPVDILLAGSTDGQDGPTDVAGCFASHIDWLAKKNFTLQDALDAKRSHNSNIFWEQHKPDWLVKTGPTGTNVMDIYVLLQQFVPG